MSFVKKSNTYQEFAFASVHTSDPTFSHSVGDLYNKCQRGFSDSDWFGTGSWKSQVFFITAHSRAQHEWKLLTYEEERYCRCIMKPLRVTISCLQMMELKL